MSAAPYTPTNVEPPNGAENVSLTPTLISSDFSDPDPDDVHQASQWQIADLLRDFSTPIFDSGTDTDNLISITIPTGILRYDAYISIFDLQGQLVKMINLGKKSAGSYITKNRAAYWDGRNSKKEEVSSGIYFYQLQAGDYSATKRLLYSNNLDLI